jgi:hypothetical protein
VPQEEEPGAFEAFAVICKVSKGKKLVSYLKNGIKSRVLKDFEGHNIKIE